MCPSAVNMQSPPSQSSIIGSGAVFTRNRLNYLFMYYAVCRRRWLWLHNNWRQSGTTPLLRVHRDGDELWVLSDVVYGICINFQVCQLKDRDYISVYTKIHLLTVCIHKITQYLHKQENKVTFTGAYYLGTLSHTHPTQAHTQTKRTTLTRL